MSKATRKDTQSPALHVADSHDLIRVQARASTTSRTSASSSRSAADGVRGVSGSGKSSLVFDTIAAESQRMINETYSAFVQGFMPTLARPEVDVLDGLTTAIIVDQQRMGADPRSTVGTATDTGAMLRILFSQLGSRAHRITPGVLLQRRLDQRSGRGHARARRADGEGASQLQHHPGGMCPRCEGRGSVTDFDLSALYDDSLSLNEGALTIPGYSMDGWYGRIFSGCGFFDPGQADPHVHQEGARCPAPQGADQDQGRQHQPDVRGSDPADPEVVPVQGRRRAPAAHPRLRGAGGDVYHLPRVRRRLSEAARSSRIRGINIADACAMQISDLAEWVRGLDEPSVAPLLGKLQHTLESLVEIGLGYLSLDRPSGTLSGGEAQRVKMIRHLGSSLTDVTYVFDEPTTGLHPHDVQRMNDLLLRLRDKGNTVLVVGHERDDRDRRPRRRPRPRRGYGGRHRLLRGHRRGAAGQRHPLPAAISTAGPPSRRRCGRPRHAGDPRRDGAQPARRRRRHPARGACRRRRRPAGKSSLVHGSIPAPARVWCRWTRARSAARDEQPGDVPPDCSTRSAPRSRRPTA